MNTSLSYVLFGGIDSFDGQPMFWSNEQGWVDLSDATIYPVWELPEDFGDPLPLVPYEPGRPVVRVRLPCLTPTS